MAASKTAGATPADQRQELLSIQEAADFLKSSKAFIYKLMREGVIPYAQLGGMRRVTAKSLEEYVREHMIGA